MTSLIADAWGLPESHLCVEWTDEDVRMVIDDGKAASKQLDRLPGGCPVIPAPRPCWAVLLAVRADTSSSTSARGDGNAVHTSPSHHGKLPGGRLTTPTGRESRSDLEMEIDQEEEIMPDYPSAAHPLSTDYANPGHPQEITISRLDWHQRSPRHFIAIPSTTTFTLRLTPSSTSSSITPKAKMIAPWLKACSLPNLAHIRLVNCGGKGVVDAVQVLIRDKERRNEKVDVTTLTVEAPTPTPTLDGDVNQPTLHDLLAHLPYIRTLNLVQLQDATALVKTLASDVCGRLEEINIQDPMSMSTQVVLEVLEARHENGKCALERVRIRGVMWIQGSCGGLGGKGNCCF